MSRWYSVLEKLPEESNYYLCAEPDTDCAPFGAYLKVYPYSTKHQKFNAYDTSSLEAAERLAVDMPYWTQLPEYPEPDKLGEWVPVEKGLPNRDGWYLYYVPAVTTIPQVSLYSLAYNNGWHDERFYCDDRSKSQVTHWMEIPRMPLEEREKMIKNICQICGREGATERHPIALANECGGYTQENLRVCFRCMTNLRNWKNGIESAFYSNDGNSDKLLGSIYAYVWRMYHKG